MKPDHRRGRIIALVRERGRVTVDELADILETSRETIRRDLTQLSDRQVVRKFHGGAAMPEIASEGSFQARMGDQTSEKRLLARAAARLFETGDSVFVDTGSTTVMFAEELAQVGGMTVITNSAVIATAISRGRDDNTVFLIGGMFRPDGQEVVGPLARQQIAQFRPRHAVLTVGAINAVDGVMDYDVEEAEIARTALAHVGSVTVLADSSKFGRTALFRVCAFDAVSRLVTDRQPTGDLAEALRRAGVTVIVADGAGV